MGPTRKRQPDRIRQPGDRRRRRTLAILASALVTLPVALSADVAVNLVSNTAQQGPLAATRTFPVDPTVPSDLGATGTQPHNTSLSPQILHNAGNESALATGAGPRADLPSGPLGIPGVVLDAYLHAQNVMKVENPGCKLPWWLLAGIGKIESNQAENGEVDANGTTLRPILGPVLNGSNGFANLPIANGGFQRAQGPMQFIPSTWAVWGRGGNINNVYDSALAAGRYLCSGGGDLSQPADQATAVFSYNHSNSYVQIVLLWANAYRHGVTPLPETPVAPETPGSPDTTFPSRSGVLPVGQTGGTKPSKPGTKPAGSGTAPDGTGSTAPGSSSSPAGTSPTPTGSSAPPSSSSTSPTTPAPTCTTPPPPPPSGARPSPTPSPTAAPTPTLPPCDPPTTTTDAPPPAGTTGTAAAGSTDSASAADSNSAPAT
ncbi:MAG TPA: lytic murein transglycosylase [Pseudonocardiaceae bacterium]|nr:lytic murein transglycosylase [Pseudonocardiaceae bacterium]